MRASVVGVLVLVAACSQSPTAPTIPIGQDVVLSPGQTATIEGASIALRFDDVRGDVRCPPGFSCIQGGNATVDISVLADEGATRYELQTANTVPGRHGDLTITLVDLRPFPFGTPQGEEYRATFRVTR